MESLARNAELRRHAAFATMHRIDLDAAEEELRSFTGGSGSYPWESELWDALRTRAAEPLLAGHGDAGHRFVFSPSARAGFWTLAGPNLRGKGQLRPAGIEALTEIARDRGLIARTSR